MPTAVQCQGWSPSSLKGIPLNVSPQSKLPCSGPSTVHLSTSKLAAHHVSKIHISRKEWPLLRRGHLWPHLTPPPTLLPTTTNTNSGAAFHTRKSEDRVAVLGRSHRGGTGWGGGGGGRGWRVGGGLKGKELARILARVSQRDANNAHSICRSGLSKCSHTLWPRQNSKGCDVHIQWGGVGWYLAPINLMSLGY